MHDVLLQSERVTLLDLLDRLLETGVVVDGEIDLSVADINLVHLGLKLVLASSATLEQFDCAGSSHIGKPIDVSLVGGPHEGSFARCPSPPVLAEAESPTNQCLQSQCAVQTAVSPMSAPESDWPGDGHPTDTSRFGSAPRMLAGAEEGTSPRVEPGRVPQRGQRSERLNFEAAKVEHGLAKLVLTLVELIRRLMEKQAVRKMDCGALTDVQTESLGEAFRRLEAKMVELKRVFNLGDEELNLDLGPLGALM
jgi:hypothetical protein